MAHYKVVLNKAGEIQLSMIQKLGDGRTVSFARANLSEAELKEVAEEAAVLAKSRRPPVVIGL